MFFNAYDSMHFDSIHAFFDFATVTLDKILINMDEKIMVMANMDLCYTFAAIILGGYLSLVLLCSCTLQIW